MAIIEPNSSSALYKGLSSYWIKAFKDSAQLEAMYSGTESLLAQLYLDLMETVLSKSLTNIPVYKKEDWHMLVLQDNLLSFAPAIPSQDTQTINGITIEAIADTARVDLENTYIAFTDVHGRRDYDRQYFHTYGVFNNFLVGKSSDPKVWTVVIPSNMCIEEAISLTNSRVISNKEIVVTDTGAPVEFTLIQRESVAQTIIITSAEQAALSTPNDLAVLINSKLTLPDVAAEIQASQLVITSNTGSLRVSSANAECTQLLQVMAFSFIINMKVPSLISDTKVWDIGYYVQLYAQGYTQGGNEFRFELPIVHGKYPKKVNFVCNTLYAPSIIMEEGTDYRVSEGFIHFVSNPFELDNIAYRVIDGHKQLGLWMSDIAYDNTLLYERYGYRYTEPRESSIEYKEFLRGMMFYFTDGPILENIKTAMDLVAGIPVALENGEIVVAVTPLKIVTDKNEYILPHGVHSIVVVNQVLHAFESITDAFTVEDYVTNPVWYNDSFIPKALMPLQTPEFRVVREHTHVPVVGEQGFIVGNADPSAYKLITDIVVPYGNWYTKYKLSSDAYFAIEFKDTGVSARVLLPAEYTASAYALSDVAIAINKAMLQLENAPYTGTILDYDAVFTVNEKIITVPLGTYTNYSAIIAVVNAQLPTGVELRRSEDPATTTFLSNNGEVISITDVNTPATTVMGIQGAVSFQGVHTSAVNDTLVFTNVSSDPGAYLKIYDINPVAYQQLGMRALLPGSGHLIGDEGQGSTSYKIFDELLKYNTFRVSFKPENFSMDGDLHSLAQIVLEGRPTYTAPVITPFYTFEDSYSSEDNINDPDTTQYLDLILSTDPAVRVQYDNDYKKARFGVLDRVDTSIILNSGLSKLRFRSKDTRVFDRFKQQVTIGVENHLDVEESYKYNSPGVYNTALQSNGAKYPLHYLTPVLPGVHSVGIYQPDTTLVSGPYLTELDGRIDCMFIMDATRPDSIQDLGFSTGDFLMLRGWPDAGNNGDHSILNVSYNVKFNGQLVDILWLQNPLYVADNFLGTKSLDDESLYGFRYSADGMGKKWFITLPDFSNVESQVAYINSALGDDKQYFPFDISYEGASSIWPYTGYHSFFIEQEHREPYSFKGERFQVSRSGYPAWDVGDPTVILGESHDFMLEQSEYTYLLGFNIGHTSEMIGGNIVIGPPEDYAGGEFSTLEEFEMSGELDIVDTLQLSSRFLSCTQIGDAAAIIGAPGYQVCQAADVGGPIGGCTTIGSSSAVVGASGYVVCASGTCVAIGSVPAVIGASGYVVCVPSTGTADCWLAKYPGGDPLAYPVGNYAIICQGDFVPTPIPGYVEYVA